MIATKLKLPLLLGYLFAGLVVGPFTPGFVADSEIAHQLSEIGVSLLMFGVGLHFSIKDLWSVRKIAIPGALVQIAVATILGIFLARFWGWSLGAGIVFGLCLSVASTVVLLRAMGERGLLESVNGKIAVGWLIVEDLVTVVALVALPALSASLGGKSPLGDGDVNVATTLLLTFGKVSVFVVAMLVIGKKLIPMVLGKVARTGSRELFTLGVLAVALGIAFGASALFGISPALGAFFAGVVISESDLSYQAGAEMLSMQEVFTVLFFVSVGMLFNPTVLMTHPLEILMTLSIILVGKSVAAMGIVLLFKYPIATALTIAASLAQIGEFSFILMNLGISLELVSEQALSIVLAAAVISIAVNPLIFKSIGPIDSWLKKHPAFLNACERDRGDEELIEESQVKDVTDHVLIIGYGRVGATIVRALRQVGIDVIVVDQDRTIIEDLQKEGVKTIFGDATRPGILTHAGLDRARLMVVATPSNSLATEIVRSAKESRPDIPICVRTHDNDDAIYYAGLGVERIVFGELELSLEMADYSLRQYEIPGEKITAVIGELRDLGASGLARPVKD